MGGAWKPNKGLLGSFALLGIILGSYCLATSLQSGPSSFYGMLTNDPFSNFFRTIIMLIAGIVVLMSLGYSDLEKEDSGEYYFFLLVLTIAMLLAVSSNHLMMIYIALESVSIISYIMAGYLKRDVFSSEAGIKYFLFGTFSTGIALYGISLIYGLFGTLDLITIIQHMAASPFSQPALLLSVILVFVGFGFKCSLVPFHMWTPDVYQGAPTPVAALFSVGPKAMGFAFLLRVFVLSFQSVMGNWNFLMILIAILTMTVGNITALKQDNIKRLLAYSTIAQAGYIFIGITVATLTGIKALFFYILVYSLMNLGAFAAVILVANALKSEKLEDYAGLYKREPLTTVCFTVLLLSLAGIPPLAGFLAKFFILAAAVEAKFITLAVIAVINSVIAAYYYLRVIRLMILVEPKDATPIQKQPVLQLVLLGTLAANVLLGIWPNPVLNWLAAILN